MYYLYKFTNLINGRTYYGMTNNVKQRISSHICSSKSNKTTNPFHNAIRLYGIENFNCEVLAEFEDRLDCCEAEIEAINNAKSNNEDVYNLHPGGEGGFSIFSLPEEQQNAWREKQRNSRKGKTPALGMKHTEDNKNLFGMYGKLRWDIYGRYPVDEIMILSFIEANRKYGISKTHYYRLRKQFRNNESE